VVRVIAVPTLQVDPEDFTRAVNLNGTALLYLVQAALPILQRGSSVFFLSSRGGRTVIKNYAAVGVGKALAESLLRYLAVELAPRGIRINAIAPGAVDTDALRAVFGADTDKVLKTAAEQNPSGRSVQHDDYVGLVEFLASPAAEMIQGQVIFVNGGITWLRSARLVLPGAAHSLPRGKAWPASLYPCAFQAGTHENQHCHTTCYKVAASFRDRASLLAYRST
jgi:enoyl-[acyl-carrier-protein] reductase (NADH)